MKIESRVAKCLDEKFYLSSTFGYLLKGAIKNECNLNKTSTKIREAESVINNPFEIKECKYSKTNKVPNSRIKRHAKLLVWLCKHSFVLAKLYSNITLPFFDNAVEATVTFRNLFPGKQQKDLCLPRMFFAATTSKRFKEHGVGFIGAFLPSTQMHAWVIEDGMHADPWDYMWINYQPVAVIY